MIPVDVLSVMVSSDLLRGQVLSKHLEVRLMVGTVCAQM